MTDETSSRTIGGRYLLGRPIGRGGMGTVWHAHDEILGREVAVKEVRFPPEIGDREQSELRERTLREARTTARLSHPNVITTYDVVEEHGRPYIVMELLPSRSLSEVLLADGALPARRVAEIGLGMLSALETAHAAGIVHRDVKPSNVLLTRDGRAVLTDFGIATMAGDPALTSTGVVLGSPAYMSPERARGLKPGPAADLWSLGATLYAAAEGRPPFDSDNALSTLTAVISDPVHPPAVGGPLAEAIVGLLEKDPAERMDIATARTLLTDAAHGRTGTAAGPAPATTVALDRAERTRAVVPPPARARPATPTAPPSSYDDQGHRSSRLLPVALVLGLLIIGGLVAFALLTRDGSDGDPGQSGASSGESQPASSPDTTAETSAAETTPAESTPAESTPAETDEGDGPAAAAAPEGFTTYEDPSGFSVAVPEGWAAQQSSATAVDFRDPSGSRFLRIDRTDSPKGDPVRDWERQERSVRNRLADYERIGITAVDFNDWPAADWEFTFGSNTHVLNRGFVTDEDHGYALYLSSTEDQWEASRAIFQTAADTFVPAE